MNSLLIGGKNMDQVLMLLAVVYIIFGGVAVQIWSGVLRQECYLDSQIVNGIPINPSMDVDPAAINPFCAVGLDGYQCPSTSRCLPYGPNPVRLLLLALSLSSFGF